MSVKQGMIPESLPVGGRHVSLLSAATEARFLDAAGCMADGGRKHTRDDLSV